MLPRLGIERARSATKDAERINAEFDRLYRQKFIDFAQRHLPRPDLAIDASLAQNSTSTAAYPVNVGLTA